MHIIIIIIAINRFIVIQLAQESWGGGGWELTRSRSSKSLANFYHVDNHCFDSISLPLHLERERERERERGGEISMTLECLVYMRMCVLPWQ